MDKFKVVEIYMILRLMFCFEWVVVEKKEEMKKRERLVNSVVIEKVWFMCCYRIRKVWMWGSVDGDLGGRVI